MDRGKCPAVELIHAKADQLGDPKTSGESQMQHGSVALTRDRPQVGSIEQSLQFGTRQRFYQLVVGLLARNGVDLTGLVETRHHSAFEVSEECLHRSQSCVTGPDGVAAFDLYVLEEDEDHGGVQMFDLELAGLDLQPIGSEADEKLEAVGICLTGMGTCPSVAWQMLKQEPGQVGSEGGHGLPTR